MTDKEEVKKETQTESKKHEVKATKINNINEIFKLPIFYVDKKTELKENIITDLELIKTIDTDASCVPILYNTFQPTNCLAKKTLEQIPNYYSYDVNFLNDTQHLLKSYKSCLSEQTESDTQTPEKPDFDEIVKLWDEIKLDTGFREKYNYMDWSYFLYLNESQLFLQLMSFYNMTSPIISLFVPIFILIVPFFIIKARGLSVSIKEYIDILKILAGNHAIGKLFTQFHKVKLDQKLYMLISAGFYLFSIYQNILTCIRFHFNIKKIHTYLNKFKGYLQYTLVNMENLESLVSKLKNKTYAGFIEEMKRHKSVLEEYKNNLEKVSDFQVSFRKLAEIGTVLKYFYQLNYNETYNTSFLYSFGFNGYIDNLEGLIDNIQKENLHFADFNTKTKDTKSKSKSKSKNSNILKKSYYAALINKNPVKNDVKLDKAMIITGPNASGKTTVLKSALINIILSQQFGCGFYDEASLTPYKFIHCYLNIPDTSGRDSLFQAEARRCKEIIDTIKENNGGEDDSHFCVFDEIYSGTNPDEAVISALAFMQYLVKIENVQCIMTTHFIKVCKKLNKNKRVKNYHMHVDLTTNNDFSYTYKMKEGISEIHGGIKVLNDMNYPSEIINNTRNKIGQNKKSKTPK
jgi:hypothetical protein